MFLKLEIKSNGQVVNTTYSDGSTSSSSITSTTFGTWWEPDYQQSGSVNDFKVVMASGVLNPIVDLSKFNALSTVDICIVLSILRTSG